jgi:hypothetical protein
VGRPTNHGRDKGGLYIDVRAICALHLSTLKDFRREKNANTALTFAPNKSGG